MLAFVLIMLTTSVPICNATSQTTIPTAATENQGFQALRLAVTPEGYDNIGHILSGLGYSYDNIQISDLDNLTLLSTYDVVFINCSYALAGYSGSALKNYVEAGGVIYASDWAHSLIDANFDDAINFYGEENAWDNYSSKIGNSGTITANVVDSGFSAYLGSSTATVEFDLSSWVVMQSVAGSTKQYLAGTVSTDVGSMYVPITVSFDRGSGSVIYTSFHYEAQGPLAEKLMEYLVFKAVTETVADTVQSSLTSEGFSVTYDIRDGINQGETKSYNVEIAKSTDVKFVLDWHGSSLGLSVQTPAGATIPGVGTKPKYVEIASAPAGTYVVSVTGDDVPSENEPFVLVVGTGAAAGEFPWLIAAIGVVVFVVVAIIVFIFVKMKP